jgi:hypothetical protein
MCIIAVETEGSVLFNDTFICEDYVAPMVDEWNMSGNGALVEW